MVTIVSDKTYFSDSIATAVFNMGIENAIKFLNKNDID
jgi:thiamine biosynthesis lipoprotein ApbE